MYVTCVHVYIYIWAWYIAKLYVPAGDKDSFRAETSIALKIRPEVLCVFWSIMFVWTDPTVVVCSLPEWKSKGKSQDDVHWLTSWLYMIAQLVTFSQSTFKQPLSPIDFFNPSISYLFCVGFGESTYPFWHQTDSINGPGRFGGQDRAYVLKLLGVKVGAVKVVSVTWGLLGWYKLLRSF